MFGAEIVQSTYDYDTRTIGPYTIPIDIQYNGALQEGNAFSMYKFYEVFNEDPEAIAVFNNNNYCFCVVHRDKVIMRPYIYKDVLYRKNTYPIIEFKEPLQLPNYVHIGWVKTYQQCKAIYTWPWKLLMDVDTGCIADTDIKVIGTPALEPPLVLYKELINTDKTGIYYDTSQCKPVFID